MELAARLFLEVWLPCGEYPAKLFQAAAEASRGGENTLEMAQSQGEASMLEPGQVEAQAEERKRRNLQAPASGPA